MAKKNNILFIYCIYHVPVHTMMVRVLRTNCKLQKCCVCTVYCKGLFDVKGPFRLPYKTVRHHVSDKNSKHIFPFLKKNLVIKLFQNTVDY